MLKRLQKKLSEENQLTKQQMLPGLISIVEHCSEQNCDLKNFLNTYEQSWLKDTVYHKALLRLLRHLAQTDDSNPKTMMMILEYIAL